jgi:hypothetical protein
MMGKQPLFYSLSLYFVHLAFIFTLISVDKQKMSISMEFAINSSKISISLS